MKIRFEPALFQAPSVLVCCSSHEDRCMGVLSQISDDRPIAIALFHHDDPDPQRERKRRDMLDAARRLDVEVVEIPHTKSQPAISMAREVRQLTDLLSEYPDAEVILDISVLTRIHMFMLFQWFDDIGCWDRLRITYCEPQKQFSSEQIPSSFGLHSFQLVPGLAPGTDFSRSIHLMLFLGYEGDLSFASFDHIKPVSTTLVIPKPPYRTEWVGLAERFNVEIIGLVGKGQIVYVDPIDPSAVLNMMTRELGDVGTRSERARVVVPTGTNPQALGAYMYKREAVDQPSIVYARPLRYNAEWYSEGVGRVWTIK